MLKVDSNAAEVIRQFKRYPKDVQTSIVRGLKRVLLIVEGHVQQRTGIKTRRGSAGVMGRLTSYAEPDRFLGLDGAIGFRKTSGFPYELAQEFGARARPGGAMTIPVSAKAKHMSQLGQGPRKFPGGLFIPANTHVLVSEVDEDVHYVLVKSISPRLKFMKTVIGDLSLISNEVTRAAEATE